jgi:hypothetical protein
VTDTRRLKALARLGPIAVTLADGRTVTVPDAAHLELLPNGVDVLRNEGGWEIAAHGRLSAVEPATSKALNDATRLFWQ